MTLFLAGVFGLAAGGGPNWIGTCALFSCLGLGVGGNLPVDGALFLEFLPQASGNLLTLLSIFWPIGQLISSLVAWGFIPNYSCPEDLEPGTCPRSENMGWRYFVLTLGALTFLMFICRFFLFHLFESPKFLLSRGRQSEAVAVVHGIAYHNKTHTWLTEQILNEIGGDPDVTPDAKLSTMEIVRRSFSKFSTQRVGPLFKDKKLSITTCLLWFQWTTIGMAYPLFNAFLPQYLANSGSDQPTATNIVYRNYAITSVVGVPGSLVAYYTVDIKYVGRKGTMAIATAITAVFIFLFTVSSDPDFQLAFTCLEALFQNVMYGVLYAYTPEVFPAPNRGTGTGISSFLNRIAGLCAPIVAVNAGNANPKAPIYASGGLFLAAFVSMLLLPIETRGRQSL
jgi:MFS family permease